MIRSSEQSDVDEVRRRFERGLQAEAHERNKKRPLSDKLAGRNKTRSIDVAHEEAIKERGLRKRIVEELDKYIGSAEIMEMDIEKIKDAILSNYQEIERLRLKKENWEREIGGRIIDNKLILGDEGGFGRDFFKSGETIESMRKAAEDGAIFFHTHPILVGSNMESPNDVYSVSCGLCEIIFTTGTILVLIPKKKLPLAEIVKIKDEANALNDEIWMRGGGYETDAPWIADAYMVEKLQVKVIEIKKEMTFEDDFIQEGEIRRQKRKNI